MDDLRSRVREIELGMHEVIRRTDRLEMRADALDVRSEETKTTLAEMNDAWQQMIGATKGAKLAWDLLKVLGGAIGATALARLLGVN